MRNQAFGGDRAWTLEWDDLVKQTRNQERMLAAQVIGAWCSIPRMPRRSIARCCCSRSEPTTVRVCAERFRQLRGFALPDK